MNLFLHDVDEFDIRRGDTLADPKFTDGDRLRRFDVVLANPPYSLSRWDRDAFSRDTWGRNRYGTPPQSNADYAFFQHIIASLNADNGRAAILYPHGVLFRDYEKGMRRGILEDDLIEAVIGIGPNLFYNSSMEACIVVVNTTKPPERRRRVLFVDGKRHVTRRNAQSRLSDDNLDILLDAWRNPDRHADMARLVPLDDIAGNGHNLSISLYLTAVNETGMRTGNEGTENSRDLTAVLADWQQSRHDLEAQVRTLVDGLRGSS
jgi:type I restriction enzyme M protein